MKIWKSYGTEHSMNLVLIGRFKQITEAEETKKLLSSLFDGIRDKVKVDFHDDRFTNEVREFLWSKNVHNLAPEELSQFLLDISIDLKGDELHVWTDEVDVSAITKIMLQNGARIEMFSAHDYPQQEEG